VKAFADCRLYTFIDTAYLAGRTVEAVARQLCEGGSDVIQLRAKDCTPAQILDLAGRVLPITQQAGIGLVINDHPSIARKAGAFACHLGQEDFFDGGFTQARQVTGEPPEMCLGLSTHAPPQALRALQAAPDYLAIGPVFATPTKPTAPAVGLPYVNWAAGHVTTPWFAIGGIKLANLGEVLAAGATRVCVVSAILQAGDVARVCRQFKEQLGGGCSS
jgi:thiamine-phosphate pyrophosphorylase